MFEIYYLRTERGDTDEGDKCAVKLSDGYLCRGHRLTSHHINRRVFTAYCYLL